MNPFALTPLDLVIEPEAGNAFEVEGILNPAAARGPDGELYLFPRLVAKGNYSRVGIARVLFDASGDPCGIERLGIALEPTEPYEMRPDGGGGCEDPRVTFVEDLQCYVMTYTAYSPNGPRIALAVSEDLFTWQRLGLATFVPRGDVDFDEVDNKDAVIFPCAVPNPSGHPELAILNRPLFPGTLPEETVAMDPDRDVDVRHESIWISYTPMALSGSDPHQLREFTSHHRLASPASPWESLKIGSGTPPVMTRHGWMIVYHGVSDGLEADGVTHQLTYSAGVMVLSRDNPQEILYRSPEPVLVPEPTPGPRGTPSNVVFPTGIDRRADIGQPHRYDVYYGINDFRIAVARMDVPESIPHLPVKDAPTGSPR